MEANTCATADIPRTLLHVHAGVSKYLRLEVEMTLALAYPIALIRHLPFYFLVPPVKCMHKAYYDRYISCFLLLVGIRLPVAFLGLTAG